MMQDICYSFNRVLRSACGRRLTQQVCSYSKGRSNQAWLQVYDCLEGQCVASENFIMIQMEQKKTLERSSENIFGHKPSSCSHLENANYICH